MEVWKRNPHTFPQMRLAVMGRGRGAAPDGGGGKAAGVWTKVWRGRGVNGRVDGGVVMPLHILSCGIGERRNGQGERPSIWTRGFVCKHGCAHSPASPQLPGQPSQAVTAETARYHDCVHIPTLPPPHNLNDQVDRYKQLLLKQRDVMIALTTPHFLPRITSIPRSTVTSSYC